VPGCRQSIGLPYYLRSSDRFRQDLIEQLPPGVACRCSSLPEARSESESVYERLLIEGTKREAPGGNIAQRLGCAEAIAIGCPFADAWARVQDG
jgi:hypothetical protein